MANTSPLPRHLTFGFLALVVSDRVKSSKTIAHGLNNIKREPLEVIVFLVLYGNIITTQRELLNVAVFKLKVGVLFSYT